MSRLLTMTFTTADFVRSSSWQFEASPYRTAPKGPPSSLAQHDARASSWHNTTLDLLNVRLVEAATKFIRESHQRVAYLPDQLSAIATAPSAASVEVAQSAL